MPDASAGPAASSPSSRTGARSEVTVLGASFAGLLAAAAAARAGCRVTVLERDPLTEDVGPRSGVPQGSQPHVLLHRGLHAIDRLLPGLRTELAAAGGVPMDTGEMAWLSPDGWLPTGIPTYDFISLSRPLLESVVRRRVLALDGVELRAGWPVTGLQRDDARWLVRGTDGRSVTADTVVDASGRSSRLPHWLGELGVACPEPTVIEAKIGYATRRYRDTGDGPPPVGVVIAATTASETGALALPVENGEWLVCAAGYGDRRPGRDASAFDAYLRALPDPALADLTARLEPVDEVRIHRQTANRRQPYGRSPDWPAGLLVIGDALTAFNPVYGQGITVAACQAELLSTRLGGDTAIRPGQDQDDGPGGPSGGRLDRRATIRLQRDLARVADFPWAVATGEDVRYPSCSARPSLSQRVIHRWSERVNQLAAGGDRYCRTTLAGIYHMMKPATMLFGPAMVVRVLRSVVRGVPPSAPRPAVLSPAGPVGRAPLSPPPGP